MTGHEIYMQRCLQLAAMGAGKVAPNPMVGAVLVHDGRIIGEGFHQEFGGPHAEVNAINNVPPELRPLLTQATLYVSLEPCAHFGKTPPCTTLIIAHKIPKVVIGCVDPFAEVNGHGIRQLKENGIEVIVGVFKKECINLNRRFFCFHRHKRPYIILKWAESADGFIGQQDKQIKISGNFANRVVHQWRSEEQAILVGTNTVRIDNPELTVRLWKGNNPTRIFMDKQLEIPITSKILDQQAPTIIINQLWEKEEGNLVYIKQPLGYELLPFINDILYQRRITSLMVEGGANLINQFILAGGFDEIRRIVSKEKYLTFGLPAPVPHLAPAKEMDLGADRLLCYFSPFNHEKG